MARQNAWGEERIAAELYLKLGLIVSGAYFGVSIPNPREWSTNAILGDPDFATIRTTISTPRQMRFGVKLIF